MSEKSLEKVKETVGNIEEILKNLDAEISKLDGVKEDFGKNFSANIEAVKNEASRLKKEAEDSIDGASGKSLSELDGIKGRIVGGIGSQEREFSEKLDKSALEGVFSEELKNVQTAFNIGAAGLAGLIISHKDELTNLLTGHLGQREQVFLKVQEGINEPIKKVGQEIVSSSKGLESELENAFTRTKDKFGGIQSKAFKDIDLTTKEQSGKLGESVTALKQDFQSDLLKTLETVTDSFMAFQGMFDSTIKDAIDRLNQTAEELRANIDTRIVEKLGEIEDLAIKYEDFFLKTLESSVEKFVEQLTETKTSIIDAISSQTNEFQEVFQNTKSQIVENFNTHVKSFEEKIEEEMKEFKNATDQAKTDEQSVIVQTRDSIGQKTGSTLNNFNTRLEEQSISLEEKILVAKNSIIGQLEALVNNIKTLFSEEKTEVENVFTETSQSVTESSKAMITEFTNAIESFSKTAENTLNEVKSDAEKAIKDSIKQGKSIHKEGEKAKLTLEKI